MRQNCWTFRQRYFCLLTQTPPNKLEYEHVAQRSLSSQKTSLKPSKSADYAKQAGSFLLNDPTNPDVPPGTATTSIEIIDQLPNVAETWVPMGDTALIRRSCICRQAPASRSPDCWHPGRACICRALSTATCATVADGLATRTPVKENIVAIRELVDDVRLVTEAQMSTAIEHLLVASRDCLLRGLRVHRLTSPCGGVDVGVMLFEAIVADKEFSGYENSELY